ncbi:ATP-binding protein [Granulosicoccaceae sp. 1_MG-2023]|nr:ATP-binding protein [Granulosicoccaceae sp. 1_MG-2023]
MNSITARLLLASSLVLALFIGLTALSLQHSVHSRAEQAQRDRMEGLIYGVLGAAELDDQGRLIINEYGLPDGRLRQPQSGLTARIYDLHNRLIWQSPSDSGDTLAGNDEHISIGQWRFRLFDTPDAQGHFSLRFGFSWAAPDLPEQQFNILLRADASDHAEQLALFDQKLWTTLLSSALLLLLVQLLVLMWGLKPLAKMSRGLQRIRAGEQEALDTRLPHELRPVAHSINTLLQSEHNRRMRYRHVMDDLAHSLKTPLSVLQNLSDSRDVGADSRQILREQSGRMRDIVAYHIRRASVSGSRPLGPAVPLVPLIERLGNSLKRVYARRDPQFEIRLNPQCRLRMDEPDIMEVFGNLLENACKYGASRVRISSERSKEKNRIACIHIEDNGPGFPADVGDELLERGKRADTRIEGQGLGLAVSNELLSAYGASLKLGASEALGGARVTIYFSATI